MKRKNKDQLLEEISKCILGCFNRKEKRIFSPFSDPNSITWTLLAERFLESESTLDSVDKINSEDITARVVRDIGRDLTDEETLEFKQIREAWSQWQYINELIESKRQQS